MSYWDVVIWEMTRLEYALIIIPMSLCTATVIGYFIGFYIINRAKKTVTTVLK